MGLERNDSKTSREASSVITNYPTSKRQKEKKGGGEGGARRTMLWSAGKAGLLDVGTRNST